MPALKKVLFWWRWLGSRRGRRVDRGKFHLENAIEGGAATPGFAIPWGSSAARSRAAPPVQLNAGIMMRIT